MGRNEDQEFRYMVPNITGSHNHLPWTVGGQESVVGRYTGTKDTSGLEEGKMEISGGAKVYRLSNRK